MKKTFVLGAVFLALPFVAQAGQSLCTKKESILFSCRTSTGIVSVCASDDLSASAGYIQYRFGFPRKIVMEYPKTGEPPSAAFTFKPSWGTHGGTDALRFKNGEYVYTVWQSWDKGIDDRGVTVKQNGVAVTRRICRSEKLGDWSLDAEIAKIKKAGVPEPRPEDDEYEF